MKRSFSIKLRIIGLFPILISINYILSHFPEKVESFYSTGIYRIIGQSLSLLTGLFPFSIAEIAVILLSIYFTLFIVTLLKKIITEKQNSLTIIKRSLINLAVFFTLTYGLFLLLWGFNYHRLPFSSIAKLEIRPATIEELESLCTDLIIRANELRNTVTEDEMGIMSIPDGIQGVFDRAFYGFEKAAEVILELGGRYGNPKGVLLSNVMNHTGISGIYFPFTAEANVNVSIPSSSLPSTICHEMAHQRGFAREDEANYIAYVACNLHPHADFRYSGTLLAMIHSMNALARYDSERYHQLKKMYSEGLRRDLNHLNEYWKQYEGLIEKTSTRLNNIYLKSNMQHDGVYSYGRMVDLLLAEYRDVTESKQ